MYVKRPRNCLRWKQFSALARFLAQNATLFALKGKSKVVPLGFPENGNQSGGCFASTWCDLFPATVFFETSRQAGISGTFRRSAARREAEIANGAAVRDSKCISEFPRARVRGRDRKSRRVQRFLPKMRSVSFSTFPHRRR